jgi:hypothetical protein
MSNATLLINEAKDGALHMYTVALAQEYEKLTGN